MSIGLIRKELAGKIMGTQFCLGNSAEALFQLPGYSRRLFFSD